MCDAECDAVARTSPGRRASRPAAALALLLGLVAALWHAGQPAARAPHPEAMACAGCHVAGDAVTAEDAHRLTESQERLCAGCHEGAVDLSHPSGIPASRPPPADLPLDRDGRVTCSTCHDVHASRPGRLRSDRRGAEFCHSCHEAGFFDAMRDGGQSIVRSGHIAAQPAVRTTAQPAARTAALAVDEFSVRCLECHGDRATYGASRHGGTVVNHPVGKDYARWLDYGGYRAVSDLPDVIRLPGGQVSCVSCHEGYTREHGKLVMANNRSQLCFGCHDL